MQLPQVDDFILGIIGEIYQGEDRDPISAQDRLTQDILNGAAIPKTILDAKELHISIGKGPRNKVAQGQFDRAWNLLFEVAGNKAIAELRRPDTNEFGARLAAKGQSAETIRKYVAQVSPVLKLAIREFELGCTNVFEGLHLPKKGQAPRQKRFPSNDEQLRAIQARCREMDDPRRWLIEAPSDTRARLSEIQGLEQTDVFLDAEVPYIHFRINGARGLKTADSDRKVPLVGEALWAIERAMEALSRHVFPTLLPSTIGNDFASGSASSALGKWLKGNKLARKGQVLHSFRHTIADRLRNAGVSAELMNGIGGWKTPGMSARYGAGFSLQVKRQALLSVLT